MTLLKNEVKIYIVQALASYDTPQQVADAVYEEYGIEIDRSQVQQYDPTKVAGKTLGKKHSDLFYETRKKFLNELANIPISHKVFRLRSLQRMHDFHMSRKNYIAAQSVLEQAAKEVGQLYTNKIQHGGDKDNPMLAFFQQISGNSIPVVYDVSNIVDD
ncbi:MAG: hypothetical protein CTY12_02985 [Methylotenera sp.]|nr:MAG: hypothetical protein CTY12_02985 [Methylotenera sp.]